MPSNPGTDSKSSDKPLEIKKRVASEAQIAHRKLFGEWAKSRSGMKFLEWKSKKSEVKEEVPEVAKSKGYFKEMIAKRHSKKDSPFSAYKGKGYSMSQLAQMYKDQK